jgi:hypothetical protein
MEIIVSFYLDEKFMIHLFSIWNIRSVLFNTIHNNYESNITLTGSP